MRDLLDRDVTSCWRIRIASQPLFPRETRVRSLRTGQDRVRGAWQNSGRRQAHLDALVSYQLQTGAPVFSPAPISPEQWCGTHLEWMQPRDNFVAISKATFCADFPT